MEHTCMLPIVAAGILPMNTVNSTGGSITPPCVVLSANLAAAGMIQIFRNYRLLLIKNSKVKSQNLYIVIIPLIT